MVAGQACPKVSKPVAQADTEHQFVYYTRLGEGREVVMREQLTPDYKRVDIQFFFFNDTATTEIYTLSLHDALPISQVHGCSRSFYLV